MTKTSSGPLPKRAASIDIGTNSALLLVADTAQGELRAVREEARITRLGEGVHAAGYLNEAAIRRTLHAIGEYAAIGRDLGAGEIYAVGTAALRSAANAASFIDRARQTTGIDVEIIPDEREALLTFLGSASSFGRGIVVLDIGGGSTEIIAPFAGGVSALSIGIGVVVLKEEFQRHDPPTSAEIAAMSACVANRLDRALVGFPHGAHNALFVAAAGTATTLAAMHRAVDFTPELIHGSNLSCADIDALIGRISTLASVDIAKLKGVQAGREDVILAGAIIMREVMSRLGRQSAMISDRGVRWGVLVERLNIGTGDLEPGIRKK